MCSTATKTTEPSDHTAIDRSRPSVAVIVPVRNEDRHIARTLDQLLDQQCDGIDVEIVVVDGRSTDRTREIVHAYANEHAHVRLLDNPRKLSSAARNIGIQNTTGEFVLIVDGHCEIPSRTYFQDMVAAFQRSGADCLGRPQPLDVSKATVLQKSIALARSSRLGHHPDSFIYSGEEVDCPAISVAVAYRRSVFGQVGMFDERFDACEDCELNHRIDQAGMRCRLVPKLTISYEPRNSLGGLFRQLFRYGRGRIRLLRTHHDTFTFVSLIPAVFTVGLFLGLFLAALSPFIAAAYFAGLLIYCSCVCCASAIAFWPDHSITTALRLPFVFVTIHLGVGIGLLYEALIPANRPTARSLQNESRYPQLRSDAT